MNKNQQIFADTQNIINENKILSERTKQLIANTKVYGEYFYSDKNPVYRESKVCFKECLTLLAAKEYVSDGKIAVLNFANPVEPGGGVLRGANAQEEYLCRASNLYFSLTSSRASRYYEIHNELIRSSKDYNAFIGTDSIIYSPNVTVIKEDIGYIPGALNNVDVRYTNDWFDVDVITCAAPYFITEKTNIPDSDLHNIFTKRIKNIFEVAIGNDIQTIILGAFGCGAFNNPPVIVADSFSEMLLSDRYFKAFKNVVFAVKSTGSFSANIEAFKKAFSEFPPI